MHIPQHLADWLNQVDLLYRSCQAVLIHFYQDLVIAIRSDAYIDSGINELIDRGHAYIEAGADVFWPLLYDCKGVHEIRKVTSSFNNFPLMATLTNYSATAYLTLDEFN